MRKRISPIWKISSEKFYEICQSSQSVSDALSNFDLKNKGANYKIFKKRCVEEGINYNKIASLGREICIKKMSIKSHKSLIPIEDVLVKNSTYGSSTLKRRLREEQILEEKCNECGITTLWNNKPLVLQLDHINGINNDNRLCNLRLLCPNCHSQTNTFAGRSLKITREASYCKKCSNQISHNTKSKLCFRCGRPESTLKNKPSKPELEILIKNNSFCAIGRMYGVSDNAIRKWARKYELL